MTGSVVGMAVFWWQVAAPAALAVTLAAGYVVAARKWPALRTPIASYRAWHGPVRCWACTIPAPYWFVRWHLRRTASR